MSETKRTMPINTLGIVNTVGNAYLLTGQGSLVIRAGFGDLWIGISEDESGVDVAVYKDDGQTHYGLISVSYDTKEQEKETR